MNTLKKFISYYRPYRAVFYFDLFCAAVISVVDLAYPQLLRSLTKTLFTGNKSAILGALPWLFLILLIMYTIQSLCKYYVTCQGHIMGAKMERDMRKQLFEHYEKLSFSYYSTHNSGQMMSKLVSDLFDISELAHHGPENLFISLVKIIGSFVFLFLINQKLALPLLLLVILMILFSIRQNKKMQQTFLENRIRIGDINASLQDTLSGIRVVQSFANEDTELHKFNHSNEAFLESKKDNYRCMGTFMSSNLFFQGMMYLTTLIYGGYLIAMGQMQAADLAMYALYIGIFISPIQILVELVEMLQKGLSGFRRYLEVVETEPEIQDKEGAIDLENVKGDVCYDNVSFHYSDDNKTVLSQVSIHIPAGKSVALVGPSGGGKTTICSLLPRFYDVTAGKVTIDGKDVRDLTLKSLRNQIGMVQQDVYLFDGTIRENIAYGKPDATDEEIKEAARRANMDDFIMQLPEQSDTDVGEKGTRLSGGQKQRISIARVFLKNPPILILDEATSALDNESERYIQKSLEELAKNRTTITIAHRLSTIKRSDEIIVITEDGIAERGTHETLLAKNGIYARYYNL
uniref:ABC transporter ATP-binding protein n=1 Tax=Eubacterium sp. TaxID=142586 RepID=UPI003FEE4AE5